MKAFFLSRLLREKILLVVLVVAAAAMWLSGAGKRAGKIWRETRSTSIDLQEQEVTLAQKESIEARSSASFERLDRARTFDRVRLQSEINNIAVEVGLGSKTNINGLPTEPASQFSVHSVNVSINNADYTSLTKFYTALQKRSPYIGIEQFDIMANTGGSSVLRQNLRVSSFDFTK
jgi:type II secretory pathway component PulK